MIRAAALVALSVIAGGARADALVPAASDAPDPAVEDAGDANLESKENRRGLTFTGAIGGGLIVGFGIDDSVGRGGSLSLRLGHVATRRTVITFEVGITAALHKPNVTTLGTQTNTNTNLAAGAQYYVNPSLWLRLAGGVGAYQGNKVARANTIDDFVLIGPTVIGGIGVDLMRFKFAVVGIEFAASAMINRDGLLFASGADVGLSFD